MNGAGRGRPMNQNGRLFIPYDIREKLFLSSNDTVEFFIEGNKMIIRKYEPGCVFCGQAKDVKHFKRKCICPECISEIARV